MENAFDVKTFDVKLFDSILSKGLSPGLGTVGEQVCIEAAICQTLGLPHGDDPQCVANSVRTYKITLNDSRWSSPTARANGLRDLGLAQLGSLGVVKDLDFVTQLTEATIRVLLPALFRELFPQNESLLVAALRCELEGSADAADAAYFAAYAAVAAGAGDKYLKLSAKLALEVLQELNSPGCSLL